MKKLGWEPQVPGGVWTSSGVCTAGGLPGQLHSQLLRPEKLQSLRDARSGNGEGNLAGGAQAGPAQERLDTGPSKTLCQGGYAWGREDAGSRSRRGSVVLL